MLTAHANAEVKGASNYELKPEPATAACRVDAGSVVSHATPGTSNAGDGRELTIVVNKFDTS